MSRKKSLGARGAIKPAVHSEAQHQTTDQTPSTTTQRKLGFDLRRPEIIPAALFPNRRVRISLDTRDPSEAKKRRAALETLVEKRAWSVLHAIQTGRLDIAEVTKKLRREGEAAIERILEKMAAEDAGPLPTFATEKEQYLEAYGKANSAESTKDVRSRLNRIGRQHVVDRNGELTDRTIDSTEIDKVHTLHLEGAIDRLTTNANSHEALRIAASGMFTWSIGQEAKRAKVSKSAPRWTTNPAREVTKKKHTARATILTDTQIGELQAHVELYQAVYLYWFLFLGLRSGELRHLRLGLDLDIANGWRLTIGKHPPDPRCSCPQCKARGWSPKSERSYRTYNVPETPNLLRRLMEMYLRVHPAAPEDYVFRNPRTNKVWTARALEDDFKRLCTAAGIRYGRNGGVTLHTLRHTCATNLLRAGVGLKHVADLIGDTEKTVAETYSHLDSEDLTRGLQAGMRHLRADARATHLRLVG